MLAVLRNRDYALLWFGQLVSVFGDWLLIVALPFAVYDLTGSALATGTLLMVQTLPRIAFGSFAGVLVDRWDRRRTMIVTDLLRGGVLLALLAVRAPDVVPALYVVAFVNATVAQFFTPAKSALLPRIVPDGQLTAANALDSFSDYLTRLVAPALGGVLYGLFGLRLSVGVDAASFAVSAACLAFLAATAGTREDGGAVGALSLLTALQEWREGLRFAAQHGAVRAIFVMMACVSIGAGVMSVAFVPFTREILGGGAAQRGLVLSAEGIGGLIGSVLLARVWERIPPATLIGVSGVGDALLLLAIVNFAGRVPISPVAFACALIAVAGITGVGLFVAANALLQRVIPDAYRGRVFGAYGTTRATMTLCGQGIAYLLIDRIGVVPTASLEGTMELVAAVLAFVLLRRAARETARSPQPITASLNATDH